MPPPVKLRAPRPAKAVTPAPELDRRGPRAGTAMLPGPAAVVAARARAGNAAVTAALGGLPRGAEPDPSGWAGQMLLAGQELVGNQAVAARAPAPEQPRPVAKKQPPKPVRKAKAPPPAGPGRKGAADVAERADKDKKKEEAAGPRSPGADPKFQALKKDVGVKKRRIGTSHPPAAAEAGAAQDAAVAPDDDQEARGKAAHAEDMDAAQPKEFDKESFIAAVEKAIRDRAPKNLDEADNFGDSGKAEEVKAEVQGKVGEGKDAAAAEIADTTAATPPPAPDAKKVVPLAADKVPGKPGAPNPDQAAPDALPKSATDMSAGPEKVDNQMAAAGVTEKQLSFKNSREPAFEKALGDKKKMEAHSATAPRQLRAGEARELKKVKGAAAREGAAAMGGMHGTRVDRGRQVTAGKETTKGRDEDKRVQVTAVLQKVFDDTKCDVEKILADLDKKVDDRFTKGEKRARDRFTDEHTRGMEEYKDRRYSGLTGKARWVKDLFADLPEEANRIYERARDNYLTAMREVIADVADTVVRELRRAKDRIAKGRKELADTVEKLPKDLKAIGKEAAADFASQFDALQDTVNDKGTQLVDTLATRYTDAVKSVDEEIAAEKEKNKGLVSKAADAIGGVINTIRELGRLLMGVLRKAASAVGLILRDPVGFLGRLISGVGGGLRQFMKDAGRYLQQGVLAWLLGSGVGGGLQLPTTFDVLGILVMIAGLLGLNWPAIRARLSRRVSPKTLAAAETGRDAIPIVVEVRKRGVAGMWSDLRSRVGDLKKDLIGKLVAYLLPTIIIAGVTWIVSLFNPASAFIRACKMIIDIVRFIVTQARQIIEFVNAVLDAVIAIARGTANVAGLVVRALARSIPVLIGALAAILGVGGIAGRVRQIFHQIARPVRRAIDWVIDKIVGLLRKLALKLKPRKPRKKPPRDRDRPRKPRRPKPPRKPRRPDRPKGRKKDRRSDKDKRRALAAAIRDANRLIGAEDATVKSVRKGLPRIKRRHRLKSIRLVEVGELHVIKLSINPDGESKKEDLGFPYELRDPTKSLIMTDVGQGDSNLRPVGNPFEEKHPAAFVVNMVAIPEEIRKNPAIASRYLTEAWAGSTEADAAALRTAVVIGINSVEPLVPKDGKGRQAVVAAVRSVRGPSELLLAVFGFTWTPRWVKTKGSKNPVAIDVLRAAYRNLDAEGKKDAERKEADGLRNAKLPIGLFRGKVFKSSYTRHAKDILSRVNKQVHVLTQDPDSTVTAPKDRGVLAAYDEILKTIKSNPMMIIGGYDFERFGWKDVDRENFTAQLTMLSNRIDTAIRVAAGKKFPEMLYPSEPSTMVKVWDEDGAFDLFDLMDMTAIEAVRDVLPFGVGPQEGHNFKKWLQELLRGNFSVIFDPRAAVSTDPKGPERGFLVRAQEILRNIKNRGKPAYALTMQSQTTASARKLANAVYMANPKIGKRGMGRIQTLIFRHVERVVILMSENPGMTARDPRIRGILREMAEGVRTEAGRTQTRSDKDFEKSLSLAHEVARDIIAALTSKKLRKTWAELRTVLRKIERGPDAG